MVSTYTIIHSKDSSTFLIIYNVSILNLDYFDKGLGNVIGAFEKAKEWADLSNCLQKVKRQIEQNKGLVIPR